MLERGAEAVALADTPSEIARSHFSVVLRFEAQTLALELPAKRIVIGKRAVMHEALIAPCGERMSAVGGDRRLRRHAGMRNAVRSRHAVEMKALGHRVGPPHFLVDFHAGAGAHDTHIVAKGLDGLARRLLGAFRNGEHAVAVASL